MLRDAETDIHPHFHKVKNRIALPTYHGGYGIQEWREYMDAAFVGSLSYHSSQHKIGKKQQLVRVPRGPSRARRT